MGPRWRIDGGDGARGMRKEPAAQGGAEVEASDGGDHDGPEHRPHRRRSQSPAAGASGGGRWHRRHSLLSFDLGARPQVALLAYTSLISALSCLTSSLSISWRRGMAQRQPTGGARPPPARPWVHGDRERQQAAGEPCVEEDDRGGGRSACPRLEVQLSMNPGHHALPRPPTPPTLVPELRRTLPGCWRPWGFHPHLQVDLLLPTNNRFRGLRFLCIASVCCYAYENQIFVFSDLSFGLKKLSYNVIHLSERV